MHVEEITCPQVTIRLEVVFEVFHVEETFEASTRLQGKANLYS